MLLAHIFKDKENEDRFELWQKPQTYVYTYKKVYMYIFVYHIEMSIN